MFTLWRHQRASSLLFGFLEEQREKGTWLMPVNICHYVPATVIKAGHQVHFIDVESDLCLNRKRVLQLVQNSPSEFQGIIFVDMYGFAAKTRTFFHELKTLQPKLKIIHDKCLSWPDWEKKLPIHSDMELYSTGYSKCVDIGYGGFAKVKLGLKQPNITMDDSNDETQQFDVFFKALIQSNQRIDMQNKILFSNWLPLKHQHIPDEKMYFEAIKEKFMTAHRHTRTLNQIYESRLQNVNRLSFAHQEWRYTILIPKREKFLHLLTEQGLFASNHYVPLHYVFNFESRIQERFPVWESLFPQVVNLFNDFRYSKTQAEQTANLILKHLIEFQD